MRAIAPAARSIASGPPRCHGGGTITASRIPAEAVGVLRGLANIAAQARGIDRTGRGRLEVVLEETASGRRTAPA